MVKFRVNVKACDTGESKEVCVEKKLFSTSAYIRESHSGRVSMRKIPRVNYKYWNDTCNYLRKLDVFSSTGDLNKNISEYYDDLFQDADVELWYNLKNAGEDSHIIIKKLHINETYLVRKVPSQFIILLSNLVGEPLFPERKDTDILKFIASLKEKIS